MNDTRLYFGRNSLDGFHRVADDCGRIGCEFCQRLPELVREDGVGDRYTDCATDKPVRKPCQNGYVDDIGNWRSDSLDKSD